MRLSAALETAHIVLINLAIDEIRLIADRLIVQIAYRPFNVNVGIERIPLRKRNRAYDTYHTMSAGDAMPPLRVFLTRRLM